MGTLNVLFMRLKQVFIALLSGALLDKFKLRLVIPGSEYILTKNAHAEGKMPTKCKLGRKARCVHAFLSAAVIVWLLGVCVQRGLL